MTVQPYQIQLIHPDGSREVVVYYANGGAHAHYTAREFHPDCQINVMGLLPEWDGEDPL